jgi:hypothetical protein
LSDAGQTSEPPDEVELPIVWIDVEEQPLPFANQFASQFQGNEMFLTFGRITPPIIIGPDDVRRQQIEALQFVQVIPVARVAMTVDRMRQLVDVLQRNIAMYEEWRQTKEGEGS